MANNKTQELSDMSTDDLLQELDRAQQELLTVRFQYATHQSANHASLPHIKRQVARIKTLLRERELEESVT